MFGCLGSRCTLQTFSAVYFFNGNGTTNINAYGVSSSSTSGALTTWFATTNITGGVTTPYSIAAARGIVIVAGDSTTCAVAAWPWSASGFGTKFANPTTVPTYSGQRAVTVNSKLNATSVFIGSTSVIVEGWNIDAAAGWGSKWSAPATQPEGSIQGINVSTSGSYLLYALGGTSPGQNAYNLNATSFGSRLAAPSSTVTSAYGNVFNTDDSAVLTALSTSSWVGAWSFSGAWGTRYTSPGTTPTAACYRTAFSPSSSLAFFASQDSTGLFGYPWTTASGFGTKMANPSPLANACYAVDVDVANNIVVAGTSTSPYFASYKLSAQSYGAKVTSPGTVLSSTQTREIRCV